jgi:hypothetical protein
MAKQSRDYKTRIAFDHMGAEWDQLAEDVSNRKKILAAGPS